VLRPLVKEGEAAELMLLMGVVVRWIFIISSLSAS
jgi:hypothetical protein